MPHERSPLTPHERPSASWGSAAADFIEGLREVPAGDPLMLLAEIFANAAYADLACVVGPRVVDSAVDAGCEDVFIVRAAHGRSSPLVDGLSFPAAGSRCSRAFATGMPLLATGGGSDGVGGAPGAELLLMVGPTLVVPVLGAGESTLPTLVLTASRPGAAPPFTAADLEAAVNFARLASAGLHLERSSTDRARAAVLSDRDRIARELHDRVIQRVFAVGLALQSHAGRATDPLLGQHLENEVGALDTAIADIRTAIFALSWQQPGDGRGVRRRILDLLEELSPLFPQSPRVVFTGAIDLLVPAPLADDLVAVVREGLTNVIRHARTRNTEVSVSALADTLTIEIGDDGVGLCCSQRGGAERSGGIANLGARADRWRGAVSLTERAPRGALLRWSARVDDVPGWAVR